MEDQKTKTVFEPVEAMAVVRDRKGVFREKALFAFNDEVWFKHQDGHVRVASAKSNGEAEFYTSHPDITVVYIEGPGVRVEKTGGLGRLVPVSA